MTEQINNAGDIVRYICPQVKVVSARSRRVLCGSSFGDPSVNDYDEGSSSHFGFGGDDDE